MTNGPKVGRKVELKIGLVLMRFLVFPNQLFTQICSYQPDYQHSHKLIPLLPKTNNSPTCQEPNSSTSTFLIKKSNEFYYRIIHTSMTLLILFTSTKFYAGMVRDQWPLTSLISHLQLNYSYCKGNKKADFLTNLGYTQGLPFVMHSSPPLGANCLEFIEFILKVAPIPASSLYVCQQL